MRRMFSRFYLKETHFTVVIFESKFVSIKINLTPMRNHYLNKIESLTPEDASKQVFFLAKWFLRKFM